MGSASVSWQINKLNWYIGMAKYFVIFSGPKPHLDYHQSDTEREIFYQQYDKPSGFGDKKVEVLAMLGEYDTPDDKLRVILGVWKPLHPNPVRNDNP